MISFTTFFRENYNRLLRMWPFIHWGEFATPIWPHDVIQNDWILDQEIDDSLASFAEDNSGEITCNQGERTRRETRECYLSKRRNNTFDDVLRDFILLYVPCYR